MGEFEAAAESLNDAITRAEDALAAKGYRVAAEIDMGDGANLRWWKRDGAWGLTVVRDAMPLELLRTSIDVRVRALRLLPDLVRQIQAHRSSKHREIVEAVELADAFIASLEEADV